MPGSVSVTCRAVQLVPDGARHGFAEPGTDHGLHATPLEAARHDQPLDLARALPDALDAELAPEPLGGVRAHVAAPAEDLHDPVGDPVRRLAREQLRHRGLRVHQLRVCALVVQAGGLVREQARGRCLAGGVGERERHALVVEDARAELLALERPARPDLEQAPHRADAARPDQDTLLDEPRVGEPVTVADRPESRGVRHGHVLERHRRVADREGVRERRVVHDADALEFAVDEEDRGPEARAIAVVSDHVEDEEVTAIAGGREPLLGRDPPAVARSGRAAGHGRGIRAGLRLGDRVGLVSLTAQRRAQVGVDLLGRAVREHVGRVRHLPPDGVGVASVGLVHGDLLEQRAPVAAVLGQVVQPDEPGLLRRSRDRGAPLGRQQAAGELCLDLVGNAVALDEGMRPRREPCDIRHRPVTSLASSSKTLTNRSTSASPCVIERVHSSSRPGVMNTPRFML